MKDCRHFQIPKRYNYGYQLFLTLQGEVRAELEGIKSILSYGEGVIYGPGQVHQFSSLSKSVGFGTLYFSLLPQPEKRLALGNGYALKLSPGFWDLADPLEQVEDWPAFPFFFRLRKQQMGTVEAELEQLASRYQQRGDEASTSLRSSLVRVLGCVEDSLFESERSEQSTWKRDLQSFLYRHHHRDISRDEAAHALGLSPSYLTQLLIRQGTNFTRLLMQQRIHRATDLLTHSRLSCKAIADQVGFKSNSYFTKVFRENLGCSPSLWRKRGRSIGP